MTKNSETRSYRAVFFDLDGTLLPIDTKEFMKTYLKDVSAFMAQHGADGQACSEALFAGVMTMGNHPDSETNRDAFWKVFCEKMGRTLEEWEALFLEYYQTGFESLGAKVTPNPATAKAVHTLRDKGYRLAVTTMPMFPDIAIEARLRWAGVDSSDFEFMTTYENSTSVKPYEAYYAEALKRAGLPGSEVLMVGNHNREDGGATKLGCDIYFVTDHLIEVEDGLDVDACKHGSMEDFAAFCQQLPEVSS